MSSASIEDKLANNKYDIDKEVHVSIREDICKKCDEHYCLFACPADCFKLTEDHITFSYEGCLECGSCKIVCDKDAIDWTLPRAGFGICYQYG
ncbi:MAG: ferredoxin family protein [Dehalococcoidia bacterium]|nr:ferredoxin family protein [Dehalococcoidia bacterium]